MKTTMTMLFLLVAIAFAVLEVVYAQEEMTKDQWQAEMTRLTARKTELTTTDDQAGRRHHVDEGPK